MAEKKQYVTILISDQPPVEPAQEEKKPEKGNVVADDTLYTLERMSRYGDAIE